jgi:serine/threonine-protein kinase CHEK2
VDLIDAMLVVDPEKRFTIDQCLSHPWMKGGAPDVNDSTNGLVGGVANLEVNRRGVIRERTLLSSLNSIDVQKVPGGPKHEEVKIFHKNPHGGATQAKPETRPADNRGLGEFEQMGGKGDQDLFDHETSNYSKADIASKLEKQNGTTED